MKDSDALELLENQDKLKKWLVERGPELMIEARTKMKLNGNQFAKRYNISPPYVSLIESGKITMGKPLAIRILTDYIKPKKRKK